MKAQSGSNSQFSVIRLIWRLQEELISLSDITNILAAKPQYRLEILLAASCRYRGGTFL
jgi:hypothetical protein